MLFSADTWPGLAAGTVTRTYRTWSRLQVRVGSRYRVAGMLLEVDDVSRVAVADLTDADAHAAGAAHRAALVRRLKTAESTVWRIDLHYVGPDDRIALRADDRLSAAEVAGLRARLDRLDAHANRPWTRCTLQLIEAHPATVSTVLAEEMAMPRPEFKTNVRKLKNLGLTESLDVGYRLSPRGQRVLEGWSEADTAAPPVSRRKA
ncbi:MAG TPA: hypothetical protein VHI14_10380 [Jatrophihabitantaceae bacterium]|jgi:hypothetical protein|nr:hypothetical protein [Jatrophihabitantaceae bacterium]